MKRRSNSHRKNSMQRAHYSRHFRVADTFLRFRLTSCLRKNLCTTDSSIIGYNKAILPQETCFIWGNNLRSLLTVPQFLLVLFPTTAWAFQAHKNKALPKFQLYNHLHGSHVFQWLQVPGENVAERVREREIQWNWTTLDMFCGYDLPLLLYHNCVGASQRLYSCQLHYLVLS